MPHAAYHTTTHRQTKKAYDDHDEDAVEADAPCFLPNRTLLCG